MHTPHPDPLWRRSLWATSAGGLFSLGYNQVIGLLVPLYLVSVGLNPFWIGVILSARSALSFLYAIHLGKLLDVVGVRRAMLGFSSFGAVLSLTYPLFDSVVPLVVLQLLCGVVAAVCWMASQAAITKLAPGHARAMGLFSFFSSAGNFIGPLAAGFIWEHGGAWPAFVFMSVWLWAMFVATLCLPPRRRAQPVPLSIGLFVPRLESYVAALRLLAISAVRFVMCLTFLRIASIAMLESFYAVLLGSKGFPASTIGMLVGLCWLVSTPAALLTAPAVARAGEEKVLSASTALAIAAIAATPLFDSLPMLIVGATLFGLGQGLGFSLVISGAARSLPPGMPGLAVGLRSTVNRAAGFVVPVVMGGLAQGLGLDWAFWISGALLLVPIGMYAVLRKGG